MSIGVIVELNLKPDGAEKFTAVVNARIPFTLEWEGCEDVYLGVDSDDPNHLCIVEKWETREHYDKFREWAMNQPGTAELMQYVIGEMTTLYLDDTSA